MKKVELVAEVAEKAGLSRQAAQSALEAAFESISVALQRGDEVRIQGFGTFAVNARAETSGRNPQTGEPIRIPAARVPRFRAGKNLRDVVNAAG
ncbi:HU family DNA-binding protein [Segnochrobactraceae bacterium EtOH-i3]